MNSEPTHMLNVSQKIILWTLVLLCVWEIMSKPSINSAIWDFCVLGIVPGTHHVLAPGTIMAGVGILFGAGASFALLRIGTRMLRTQKALRGLLGVGQLTTTAAPAVDSTWQAGEVVRIDRLQLDSKLESPGSNGLQKLRQIWLDVHLPKATPLPTISVVIHRIITALPVLAQCMSILQKFAGYARERSAIMLRPVSHKTMLVGRALAAICRRFGQRLFELVELIGRQAWRLARSQSKAFWRWLIPQLWRFDHWLEIRAHATARRTAARIHKHENLMFVLLIGREYRRFMSGKLLPFLRGFDGEK